MSEYLSLDQNKRQEIKEKAKQILSERKDIIFAFVFGSFLDSPSFRDIDIGVYKDDIKQEEVFDYELNLNQEIAKESGLPSDIIETKVLNFAPNSFLNKIFNHGQLLFCKDHQLLSDMIENTSLDALANEYIAYQSLKELVPA